VKVGKSFKRFLATTAQFYHHGSVIKREPVLVTNGVPTITESFMAKDLAKIGFGKIETLASIATSGLGQAERRVRCWSA
jgi:hypothetical protein